MSTLTIVLLVILAVLIIGLIVLYFLGKRHRKERRAGCTVSSRCTDCFHADYR